MNEAILTNRLMDLVRNINSLDMPRLRDAAAAADDPNPTARPRTSVQELLDSVGFSLKYLIFDLEATRLSDVREALDCVGLLDEVMRLPSGLSTNLQTGGAPLSDSQSRRLMLARAIVGRPRLLLLDGILDALSDMELEFILPRLCGNNQPWTLVLTTGRRTVAERCDCVLDLDKASLRRQDTSQEILRSTSLS